METLKTLVFLISFIVVIVFSLVLMTTLTGGIDKQDGLRFLESFDMLAGMGFGYLWGQDHK